MASPLTIGTTASIIALVNTKRNSIRFQNTSSASQIIYIKKIPLTGTTTTVSPTDYDVRLFAGVLAEGLEEAFETQSVASFMAISSAAAGTLAVYETVKA